MVLFTPKCLCLDNLSYGKGVEVECIYKLHERNILKARGLQIITKTLTILKFWIGAWVTVQTEAQWAHSAQRTEDLLAHSEQQTNVLWVHNAPTVPLSKL